MERFRNKYRIQSHRMPKWNYSDDGIYFITIATQNRECNLGFVRNGNMILSDLGKIVRGEWLKSFEIRDELFLDEYIIMPNHLHAIVTYESNGSHVETHGRASLQSPNFPNQSPNPHIQPNNTNRLFRKSKSISSFIAGFKSAVNSKIDDYMDECFLDGPKYNQNNHFFQPNYYDHIIRNNTEYQKIKNYIIQNPVKWTEDTFHPS